MTLAFTSLSRWLRRWKHQEPKSRKGSSTNKSPEMELNMDTMKSQRDHGQKLSFTSRRVKWEWQSREERRIDKEHDIVLVPLDGGCVSGSESDDSDWSIGWMEPHGSGFRHDDGSNDSFAVLVPCYGRGCMKFENDSKSNKFLGTIGNIPDIYASGNKKYMEQWLSSLHNM